MLQQQTSNSVTASNFVDSLTKDVPKITEKLVPDTKVCILEQERKQNQYVVKFSNVPSCYETETKEFT